MVLTLADFDCDEAVPEWLPSDKWDDVIAMSVLPGPLDSLCVQVAENADEWEAWYKTDMPENEPLPMKSEDAGYAASLMKITSVSLNRHGQVMGFCYYCICSFF